MEKLQWRLLSKLPKSQFCISEISGVVERNGILNGVVSIYSVFGRLEYAFSRQSLEPTISDLDIDLKTRHKK